MRNTGDVTINNCYAPIRNTGGKKMSQLKDELLLKLKNKTAKLGVVGLRLCGISTCCRKS